MDYCSSCRRYLNGALVCPGCGAYAPDIAPSATATTGAGAAWGFTAPDGWHDGRARDGAAAGDGADAAPRGPGTEASDGVTGVRPAPQGRAARRRQLARLKKNQRRAVIATAVALVGGGLTVATLDRGTADRAQAATAPHDTSMGGAEEQALEDPGPPAAPPRTHRATRTVPERSTQSPTTGLPPREPAAAPHRTTPRSVRPDAAASPRTTVTSAPSAPSTQFTAPSSGATVPGGSATAAQQTPAPAATGGTNTGTPPASPTPAATSPSQICLLQLVCLG